MKNEYWKKIKGYRNYFVSSEGRVRNMDTGKLLKHQSSKRGGNYAFVNLCKDGKRVNCNVHILVARAFIGPPKVGFVVHHKDHNRLNPKRSNLEYITNSENASKKINQGGNNGKHNTKH